MPCVYLDTYKDTCKNVWATNDFVVNIPSFDRQILEKVRVVGLPYASGINELEKAGLTASPSKVVRPSRIAECKSHFECRPVAGEELQALAERITNQPSQSVKQVKRIMKVNP